MYLTSRSLKNEPERNKTSDLQKMKYLSINNLSSKYVEDDHNNDAETDEEDDDMLLNPTFKQ